MFLPPIQGGLPGLLTELEQAGATVTHAAEYRHALTGLDFPHEPAIPPNLLTMDPSAITAHLRGRAAHLTLTREAHRVAQPVRLALDAELIATMREEVDDILDGLRPRFTAAAITARQVLAHGVKPTHTAEEVMMLGRDAAIAWANFRNSEAGRVLGHTAALRASLASLLDAGEGPNGDHALGITSPWVRRGLEPARRFEPSWERWLHLAPSLDLVPFAELDPEDVHEARGGMPFAQVRKLLDAQDRRQDPPSPAEDDDDGAAAEAD